MFTISPFHFQQFTRPHVVRHIETPDVYQAHIHKPNGDFSSFEVSAILCNRGTSYRVSVELIPDNFEFCMHLPLTLADLSQTRLLLKDPTTLVLQIPKKVQQRQLQSNFLNGNDFLQFLQDQFISQANAAAAAEAKKREQARRREEAKRKEEAKRRAILDARRKEAQQQGFSQIVQFLQNAIENQQCAQENAARQADSERKRDAEESRIAEQKRDTQEKKIAEQKKIAEDVKQLAKRRVINVQPQCSNEIQSIFDMLAACMGAAGINEFPVTNEQVRVAVPTKQADSTVEAKEALGLGSEKVESTSDSPKSVAATPESEEPKVDCDVIDGERVSVAEAKEGSDPEPVNSPTTEKLTPNELNPHQFMQMLGAAALQAHASAQEASAEKKQTEDAIKETASTTAATPESSHHGSPITSPQVTPSSPASPSSVLRRIPSIEEVEDEESVLFKKRFGDNS